ncbi:MAG: peptidoglycan D,D-transpeptidase FtsI family protein [Opitutales bacterium]
MSHTFVSPWRMLLVTFAIVAGFGGVLARLAYLHVLGREDLSAYAERTREMTIAENARRGDILDRRGNPLATTRPRYRVGVDPKVFQPEAGRALADLATRLAPESDPDALLERVLAAHADPSNRSRWVKLGEADPEVYERIRAEQIPGVYGNLYYERYYPAGSYAAHVIGFLNREGRAVMGVEQFLDFYLSGEPGWRETERDARRHEVAQFRGREVAARRGYDVELTIDMVVQSYVETALQRIVREQAPAGASIIVSDPRTGDILAMGNYPSFDLNRYGEFDLAAHRNRAVTDLLEPGSTFKIVPVAAALEERMVSPRTIIDCAEAVAEYRGRRLRLPSDSHPLGRISVAEVVAKSSNRGAAQLGLALGEQRLHDYAARFGFGAATRWPLLGEASGTLHDVKDWDGLTITRLPAGYAVNATPLQVHMAMSSVANGGKLLQPRLVRRVLDGQGRPVVDFPRRERERVVSEQNARMLAAMLARVASDEGTARRAAIPGFQVAGKTGTSRKIIDGQYSTSHHFASFSGFFPALDPEFAITVVVDDAQTPGVAYGGLVAAPAFREIGEKLIEYYAMTPMPERPAGLLARLGGEVGR